MRIFDKENPEHMEHLRLRDIAHNLIFRGILYGHRGDIGKFTDATKTPDINNLKAEHFNEIFKPSQTNNR